MTQHDQLPGRRPKAQPPLGFGGVAGSPPSEATRPDSQGTATAASRQVTSVALFALVGLAAGLITAWFPEEAWGLVSVADRSLLPAVVFGALMAVALLAVSPDGLRQAPSLALASPAAWYAAYRLAENLYLDHDWPLAIAGLAAGGLGAGVLGVVTVSLWRASRAGPQLAAIVAVGALSGTLLDGANSYLFFGVWQGAVAAIIGWALVSTEAR